MPQDKFAQIKESELHSSHYLGQYMKTLNTKSSRFLNGFSLPLAILKHVPSP